MSPHPIGRRRLPAAGVVAATLLLLLLPPSVSAHAELQSSDPADRATVPSPFGGPVVLTFTESLAVGSKADLYGPGHQLIASATIDAGTMTIAPPSALAAGEYTVEWVSIADDGDLLRGTLAFAVAAAASPSNSPTPAAPSVEPSTAPTSAPSDSGASAAPSPSPAPAGDPGATGGDVILPIVIALVVAAAGAFYLVRRNRPA